MVQLVLLLRARVKRRLRSSSNMTEESNGDDDDRERTLTTLDLFPVMSTKTTTDSEPVAGAVKTNAELQDGTTKIDDSTQSLFERARLLEWGNSLRQVNPADSGIAVMAKISDLIFEYGKERVLTMIAAETNVPATQQIAKNLEKALVVKYMDENRDEDFFEMLIAGKKDATEFLASPFLETWISLYPQRRDGSPFPMLFNELSKHYSEPALAQQLLVAQGNGAAKKTAQTLETYQMVIWENYGYNGDVVFERLGLKVAGIDMFDSPVWDMWISYMVWLDGRKRIPKSKLVLSVLRKHFDDSVLFVWFDAAKTVEGKTRARYIKRALEKILKKPVEKDGEASTTTKRQQNDGEAPATTKRQRNDDGQ